MEEFKQAQRAIWSAGGELRERTVAIWAEANESGRC